MTCESMLKSSRQSSIPPRISVKKLEQEVLLKKIPLPMLVANKILNILGFVNFINDSVKWNPKHCNLSPGTLAKAMILSTFLDIRSPLYTLNDRFKGMDTEALFGLHIHYYHLTDDALAHTLDKISAANPESLFSSLALSAYQCYRVVSHFLHSDTTSLSFYGEYEPDKNEEALYNPALRREQAAHPEIVIEKGYNKDHRPGCKQIVVGKIVDENGIALVSSNMNGSTSDVEWNKKALQLLQDTFGPKLQELVYIADSKLINLPTLKIMLSETKPIQFISRCPASFYKKIAKSLTIQAYQTDNWQDLGKLGEGKSACTYQIQEIKAKVMEKVLRFVVVKTSAGTARMKRVLQRERNELEVNINKVTKKQFSCQEDALKEWIRFEKQNKKSHYRITMTTKITEIALRKVGNPGKNPPPPTLLTHWSLEITLGDTLPEKITELTMEEGCFVLISHVADQQMTAEDILRRYKGQRVVEVQFAMLKKPALINAIFIKTERRVDALVMLLNVALLIRALVQYELRKSIEESTEEQPKIGRNHQTLKNPTAQYLIDTLSNYSLVSSNGEYYYDHQDEYDRMVITTLFKLLNIDLYNPF